jgi:hypothetical protein
MPLNVARRLVVPRTAGQCQQGPMPLATSLKVKHEHLAPGLVEVVERMSDDFGFNVPVCRDRNQLGT